MNTSILKSSSLILLLSLLISCTDVVNVSVPDESPRLVIEASILWEKGTLGNTQSIQISTSSPYFEENTNDPVTGATVVVIKDNDNTIFSFEDQNNGEYITNDFIPKQNQSYTLEIKYNGQTYEARETLLPITPIEEVVQITEDGVIGQGSEVELKVFFNDPPNINNYYLSEFKFSNLPLAGLASISDQFSDGNLNFITYGSQDLETGVIADINVQGISERYFNYINLLIQQSGNGAGPFQVVPVRLNGNCKNITNPSEEVLGYFRLSEVVREQYIIE